MTLSPPCFRRASLALALVATVAAGLLAPVELKPAEAAFPGDNGKIAFLSNRTTGAGVNNPTGDQELFLMKPDGSGIRQLTDNTTHDQAPAWSADGNWLAYSSGDAEIYIRTDGYVDPHGFLVLGGTRRLTTNSVIDSDPTFSPDGTKIAFTTTRDSGNFEIYVMDIADVDNNGNGDNPINLTNDPAFDYQPAWSPDGAKIAFVRERGSDSEIFVIDADGSHLLNLTNNAAPDFEPNWSPDGSKIVFTRRQDNNYEIYMMKADGSEQKRLTKKAARDENPVWSPDGKKIAFQSTRGGGDEEIYVMKARPESKKNRPKARTKNGVFDGDPDWQPVP